MNFSFLSNRRFWRNGAVPRHRWATFLWLFMAATVAAGQESSPAPSSTPAPAPAVSLAPSSTPSPSPPATSLAPVDLSLYADLTPQETLYAAARGNDLPVMQKMLDDGVDPNGITDTRWERTALGIAANENHLDAVRLLLARGADPKGNVATGETSAAVLAALRNGWLECAELLIGKGAACNPIVLAAAKGDTAAIDKFLAGKDLTLNELRLPCEVAAPNGQTAIFARLYDAIRALPEQGGWTVDNLVVMRSVARGQKAAVSEMFARYPELDRTVLRLSTSAAQSPGMREWLKGMGYETPEASDGEWLIDAAERGDLPQMRQLLAKGANPNYSGEDAWTPLTKASIGDRFKAVKLLLEHKANPNLVYKPDMYDYAPLTLAKTPRVAETLLKAGADITSTISKGREPYINYVKNFRSSEMVQWHLDHGAATTVVKKPSPSTKAAVRSVAPATAPSSTQPTPRSSPGMPQA